VSVPAEDLRRFARGIFQRVGVPADEATIIADTMVEADLRGVHSHGVMRLTVYPQRVQSGAVSPVTKLTMLGESPATLHLDGGNGMGQVVSHRAMSLCIARAAASGANLTAVRGSNHFGAAAYYAMMALPHGMIGLATTVSSVNVMAPWGGIDLLLGNNPIAIAVPAAEEPPVVLDMALSVTAKGWIALALHEGRKTIPAGWALTKDGEATTDTRAAFDGILAPTGGYKGAGLSFMIGLLAGALPGGAFGSAVKDLYKDLSNAQNVGHLFAAIDVERFQPLGAFAAQVDRAVREVRAARKAPGVRRIYVPGEPEAERAMERTARGIPLTQALITKLNGVAGKYGAPPLEVRTED
jgi:LDH2 family malate/lactate/ureidoglycolate dehydrogenase